MSDHRARYKNTGLDSKELRRRREVDSIQLRKAKRDEFLSKKRTLATISPENEETNNHTQGDGMSNIDGTVIARLSPEMVEGLMQDADKALILDSSQKIRRLLSKEPQPPFDDVIQGGLIPRLIQLLDLHEHPLIQFEVAWILTNICSGTSEQTMVVVDSGALPKLVSLMKSPDPRVCEQAIWALGNIIGDGADARDLVISYGMIPELLPLINSNMDINFLRNATWVLVNLCRNKDPPTSIVVIRQLLPALSFLINSEDETILVDTAWAISYTSELGPAYSQLIIDSDLIKKMSQLVSHDESKIQMAAIRTLGCIATGCEEQTQAVINSGAIRHLRKALSSNNDRIAKDALWFISNVVAGSREQIQSIIDEGLVPIVIQYLAKGEYQQQKEASWAIFNLSLVGSLEQTKILVDNRVIPALCDLLTLKDTTLLRNVLESLTNILKKCDNDNDHSARDEIEECGGLDKIEALQDSTNQEIYTLSYSILEEYFKDGEDDTI